MTSTARTRPWVSIASLAVLVIRVSAGCGNTGDPNYRCVSARGGTTAGRCPTACAAQCSRLASSICALPEDCERRCEAAEGTLPEDCRDARYALWYCVDSTPPLKSPNIVTIGPVVVCDRENLRFDVPEDCKDEADHMMTVCPQGVRWPAISAISDAGSAADSSGDGSADTGR